MEANQFFERFGLIQEPQQIIPAHIQFNTMLFEISNNWSDVCTLIKTYKEGNLKQITQLEKEWVEFIINNSIDTSIYTNELEFIEKNIKKS